MFDVEKYLQTAGIAKKIIAYRKGQVIFSQGDPSRTVLYIQGGRVKLAITSSRGKEAVVALLYAGDFVGGGPTFQFEREALGANAVIDRALPRFLKRRWPK